MSKLRVLLIDDHAVVRGGLKMLIDAQSDMEVIGEAANGQVGLEMIQRLKPDVAVVDINMPILDGIELVKRLQNTECTTQLLILTAHDERAYLTKLLHAGAVRCLLKRSAVDELIQAIRTTALGGQYLDSGVIKVLSADAPPAQAPERAADILSEREREVVRLIAQGYSNKEIAAQLDLSVKTVETYKARSLDKLQLHSRAALVRYALEQGWLTDS
jgi:two-component system, NarL family, response regulator NreC